MANVANSMTVEVNAARAQEKALQNRMEQLRSAVTVENSAKLGLQTLETQARATRNIYETFLSRAAQLANVAGIQEPDASLVSSADPPLAPSAPQRSRLLAVAAGLSLALGVFLACVIERLRGGFSLPEQIEGALGLPLIGLVPKVPLNVLRRRGRGGRKAIILNASLDRLRGQMRVLGEARPRLIMVTSAVPREGKSVFAAELARNTAAAGWRVLLLECDFGCPSLSRHFGLRPGPGLCEILSGSMLGSTESVMHHPEPHLNVITAGRVRGDSQELLASKRMSALLTAVRSQYDLVILDTPPVLPVADALVLARQADATVAVVRWEKTSRTAASDAIRLLRESGARMMGVAMTQVNLRTAAISGGRMSYAFSHYDGYHAVRA
jgi:polysaccharide biosynthesis transport protein